MDYDHHHFKIRDQYTSELFQAILHLQNIDECYRFFEDICTINEVHAMSQRLQVAKLLKQNIKYSEIEKETSASTATISRVNKCIKYGTNGYNIILERMGIKDSK